MLLITVCIAVLPVTSGHRPVHPTVASEDTDGIKSKNSDHCPFQVSFAIDLQIRPSRWEGSWNSNIGLQVRIAACTCSPCLPTCSDGVLTLHPHSLFFDNCCYIPPLNAHIRSPLSLQILRVSHCYSCSNLAFPTPDIPTFSTGFHTPHTTISDHYVFQR